MDETRAFTSPTIATAAEFGKAGRQTRSVDLSEDASDGGVATTEGCARATSFNTREIPLSSSCDSAMEKISKGHLLEAMDTFYEAQKV